jgi:hypothetical protein
MADCWVAMMAVELVVPKADSKAAQKVGMTADNLDDLTVSLRAVYWDETLVVLTEQSLVATMAERRADSRAVSRAAMKVS